MLIAAIIGALILIFMTGAYVAIGAAIMAVAGLLFFMGLFGDFENTANGQSDPSSGTTASTKTVTGQNTEGHANCETIGNSPGVAVPTGHEVPAGSCVVVEVVNNTTKQVFIYGGRLPIDIATGALATNTMVHINAWTGYELLSQIEQGVTSQIDEQTKRGFKVTKVSEADLAMYITTFNKGGTDGNPSASGSPIIGTKNGNGNVTPSSGTKPLKTVPTASPEPSTQPSSAGNVQRVHLGQNIWKGVQLDLSQAKAGTDEFILAQGDTDNTGTCSVKVFSGQVTGLGSATYQLYLIRGGTQDQRKQEVQIISDIAARESPPCPVTYVN